MAPGKHLLKLLNGGDDRGRGAAKKKQVPKLRNGCGDQEKPNTKDVEIAQRLWRHPIEHTDDSPRISHSPLGRIRKKGGHIQTSNCSEGCGNQGREKKEMWRPRGSETINVLSLRNGCGDPGVRTKKRHVGSAPGVELDQCVEIARWMWRPREAEKRHAKKSCVKIA